MVVRQLAPEEYPLLTAVAEGFVPDPQHSRVVCAFKDTRIIGRSCLVTIPHIEGTWVAEDFRGSTTGPRLIRAIELAAKEAGLPRALAFTLEPKHTEYMERLGWTRTALTVLSKEL